MLNERQKQRQESDRINKIIRILRIMLFLKKGKNETAD